MQQDTQFCPVCQQESSFSMEGGLLQCDNCGSLLQDFIQEEQEFEDTQMTKSRAYSSAAEALERPSKAPKTARFQLADAAFAYSLSMQALLRAQVAWLVEHCGTCEALDEVVHNLWRAYVLQAGLLEPRASPQEVADGLNSGLGGDGPQQDEEKLALDEQFAPKMAFSGALEVEDRQQDTQGPGVTAAQLQNTLWSEAPPRVSLEIIYLGVLILREALQPTDIVRLAARAQLPFLKWRHVAAEALQRFDARSAARPDETPAREKLEKALPPRLLQPRAVPSVKSLMDNAASLATLLEVQLPPINSGALLYRWTIELKLPEPISEAAVALAEVYLFGSGRLHLCRGSSGSRAAQPASLAGSGQPYAHLMSTLVLAARLVWGLDGRATSIPGLSEPPPDWQRWAVRAIQRIERPLPLPSSGEQAARLSDAQIEDYLHFCKTVVFSGATPPDELQRMEKVIQATALKLPSAAWKIAPQIHCTLGIGKDEGYRSSTISAALQRNEARGKSTMHDREASKKDAVPNEPDKCEVHPDYAALLIVASRLLWVKASELHGLVTKLERKCVEVEKAARETQP